MPGTTDTGRGHDPGPSPSAASVEERLARAAAVLAAAEGWGEPPTGRGSGAPSGAGSGAPWGRASRTRSAPAAGSSGSGRGRRAAPPPPDPAGQTAEADAESVARAIVLRQLSMAPRSRAQLERKLRDRGCDDDVAARVLDRMTEVGLVDDEAYAQMLVRSRHETKGLARKALAHELRKQGVDPDVAGEALEQVDADDERARAEQLVARRLRSMSGLAPDVQARRLAGMLARKGYSGEVAWPVVRDAVNLAPEHQRD